MFKNYLTIAFRNLLKNKTHSAINIFGLAVAFVCSILLFLTAYFDFSYDNFHADKNRIYKVYNFSNKAEGAELGSAMSYPAAPTLKNDIQDIEYSSRYQTSGSTIRFQDKEIGMTVGFVDNSFLNIFSFPVLKGNKANPLSELGNIVMTETAAKKVFNTEDAIGKLVKMKVSGEWKDLVVSAIVQDFPRNSTLSFDVLARPELRKDYAKNKDNWNMQNHAVYVKLTAQALQSNVEDQMRYIVRKAQPVDEPFMKAQGYVKDAHGDYYGMRLLPFLEEHFNGEIGGNNTTSKTYLYMIILIGFFIMAIACFNFINLNVARAFTRMKEVGVRKCLGANKSQIFTQIWGESLIICVIAFLIGILGATLLLPEFNKLMDARLNLSLFKEPLTIVSLVVGMLLVSLLAGGYPALIVSKFNTATVLKGKISFKKSGIFRNSLIVLQFTIACLLMICTVIAFQQFEYMRTKPLGFNQEAVISIPISNYEKGHSILNQFRNRVASQPTILSVTGSDVNIGIGKDGDISKSSSGFSFNGNSISTNWLNIDYDFLKTMDIKLLEGRDFSSNFGTDTLNSVIVTEGVAKQFKVKDPIGLAFYADSSQPKNIIIGIVPDFHLYSLHENLEPTMMSFAKNGYLGYILVKTTGKNPTQTMTMVENIYKEVEPGKLFQGSFIDENTNRWYQKEKKLSQLLGISSGIAILLSCLGLFAIALLMIEQRVKEIGVRKVLGASVTNITSLLSKDFLQLVIVAILIASPVAWWAMHKWLQDFPYRITISWWIFILTGLAALLIAFLTVSFQAIKAALMNPVKSLRTE